MNSILFDIDDLIEEIEEKYGKVEELTEADCMDIIYDYVGNIKLNTAYYDKQFSCIFYEPEEEEEEDDVAPEWSERYLNTLGMSMSDFF